MLIADAAFMRASDSWFRWTARDVTEHADGPSLGCAGLAPGVELAAMLGPRPGAQSLHASWLDTTRDVHLATAPAFGFIAVADATDRGQLVEAGRLWQRTQLEATLQGLGMQPLDQALEASDRSKQLGLVESPPLGTAMVGGELAMMFRVGFPIRPAAPSPRRPLGEVII
jgi:hypothetical protein